MCVFSFYYNLFFYFIFSLKAFFFHPSNLLTSTVSIFIILLCDWFLPSSFAFNCVCSFSFLAFSQSFIVVALLLSNLMPIFYAPDEEKLLSLKRPRALNNLWCMKAFVSIYTEIHHILGKFLGEIKGF